MRKESWFQKPTEDEFKPSDFLRNSGHTRPLFVRIPLEPYMHLTMMSAIRKMPMNRLVAELIEAEWDNFKGELSDPAPKDIRRIRVALDKLVYCLSNN